MYHANIYRKPIFYAQKMSTELTARDEPFWLHFGMATKIVATSLPGICDQSTYGGFSRLVTYDLS